jgi:K+-transporting ATPase ATPase C chain
MKANLLPAIKLSILCVLFFVIVYGGIVWAVAQVIAPNHGKGEVVMKDGKIIGFMRIGQRFTADKYFWSRPSAVDYNAAGSAGSNKGPTNPEYLADVEKRITYFLAQNPGIQKKNIPVELVTASGSGLDPHLSLKASLIQIPRIAHARGIGEEQLIRLVKENMDAAFVFGPRTVNVLKLNLALDRIK